MKQDKLNEYINKAKIKHNNAYTYEKTNPQTCKDKCIVTCKVHGDFLTTLDNHANQGTGCPKCAKVERLDTEKFITKAKLIHGEKYNYRKVNYKNIRTKVCIICQKHGEFWQEPRHHLDGRGCPMCSGTNKLNTKEFIERAKLIHGDKYDYSKVNYVNTKTKVCIICPEHGEFWQTHNSHIKLKTGCPKCAKNGVKLTNEEFINKAKKTHGDYYSYIKTEYINAHEKVCIICPRHGEFWQEANIHLAGKGCPKCKSSKLENITLNNLNKNNIKYIFQYTVGDLKRKTIDFYLPDYNIAIECQGEQHYYAVDFSRKNNHEYNNNLYEKRKILDELKYNECINNGIELIYFTIPSYFNKKDINIYTDFYKNKMVFTNIDQMINYIKNKKKTIVKNIFRDFCDDILKLNINFIIKDNALIYKNHIIIFSKNNDNVLREKKRYYKKRYMNVIHILENEYINNKNVILNQIKNILQC